jgi:hypothetical protein
MAQTKITVATDTNFVFIGDVINLDLLVQSNDPLIWPDLEESLVPLEIQDFGKIDTSLNASSTLYKQRIAIQSFDTGRFVLPSLAFTSLKGDTFFSDSLAIAFLEVPLDTTNAIFDIKQPRQVPFNFAEAQPYIWGSLALLLLLALILYLVKKFSKKSSIKEEEIILIPCEIEAEEALTKLQAKEYISKGLVKIHYVELTEILRRYFDREFEIDSLESTTEETLALLKNTKLAPKFILSINELLEEADLVKFAKSNPDERTSNNYMKFSFTIIENCHKTKMEVKDVS